MKRSFLAVILVVFAWANFALAAPALLIRVDRKTNDDLADLRRAGFAVVLETRDGLLIRGEDDDLRRLRSRGFEPRILDDRASDASHFVVGLRPDSDLELVRSVGTTLFTEENLLVLRVAPGASVEALHEASVFARRVSVTPAEPPRPESAPAAATDGTADPIVQKIVSSVSDASIQAIWQDLTTNAPTGTRYSTAQGCRDAAAYCLNSYGTYGIPAVYQNWNASHAPNVVATQEGAITPDDVYIIIGHLDDLPSSGTAPGADDNASGSVIVLESAKRMSCWAFRSTVKYLNVTGEEFGLFGSEYYADDAAVRGEKIRGVINFDMPGWAGDGIPAVENLDLDYNTPSQWLADRFADAAATYGTGLSVNKIFCPSLNASDHYPFWQKGWSAVIGITDNEGYCGQAGNYPQYHTSADTIANCGNPAFFYSGVRTAVATLAELAEPFKITFDRPAYACGSSLEVVVGDRDLDTNPATAQSVSIRVWSTSEPAGETIVLDERGVHSMFFDAVVPTSAGPVVAGDGVVTIVSGDVLEAEYTDALDCDGAANVVYRASAGTDCTGPVISSVVEVDVTDASAKIRWTTDEASDSTVNWGQATPPSQPSSNPAAVTAHEIALTGLQQCTVYYYDVRSTDPAGNIATESNGGQYFHFETLGNFGSGPQPCHEGKLSLEKSVVSCSDSLPVKLVDLDLNLSSTEIDSRAVTVTSSTEASPETLTLVETGPNTATFQASIPTASGIPSTDGILQVTHADLVTATYYDADDGTGQAATSFETITADCAGPGVSTIQVINITDTGLSVQWTTTEQTTGRVDWGTTAALGNTVSDATLSTSHTLGLTPIAECGRIYFRVTSTDAYGNVRVSDSSGAPFEANANQLRGIFRDDFESTMGWTLEGEWQIAAPQGKGSSPPDPATAYQGAKVLGHDLTGLGTYSGDYPTGTTQSAISPVINASTLTQSQLKFRRWLNVDGGALAYVDVKQGASWFTVWSHSALPPITASAWSLQTIDIATYADGNSQLQVRFRQNGGIQSAAHRSGWNVDKFVVKSGATPEFDACGDCGGAPTFAGANSAGDTNGCADTGVVVKWPIAPAWGTGQSGTYSVYRDTSPTFTPSASNRIATGVGGTQYQDTTAPNGVDLYYIVRAENHETCSTGPANGGVTESNLVRASGRDEIAQPAPGDVGPTLAVNGVNDAHVKLTWVATSGAGSYRIYRATEPSGPFVLLATVAATSWEDRDELGTLTARYYRVRAIDSCGNEGP